jgi:serine/threonine-protein kinase
MPTPSPQRFRQADAILDAALDLETGERATFVDRACEGNPGLRSQVLRLLRAFERSEGFLDGAAVDLARPLLDATAAPPLDAPAAALPERIGPFRVISELGRGGVGVVYLARREDDPDGILVALKTLRGGTLATGTVLRRFLAERSILATLEHPFVSRLLEAGITPDGAPYFAMAYSAGGSLADRIARSPLPVADALRIARQLAEALSAAHAVGIVHRDVKPANVLFTAEGNVQLTDFGIAKLLDHDSTQSGTLLGTPAYLAPEQIRGESLDHRADLWALGVTVYQMLAGRRPFDGTSYAAVLHAVVAVEPEPIGRAANAPPALEALVHHLLRKDPESRPQTAAEVARVLALIEADPTVRYAPLPALPAEPTYTPSLRVRGASVVVLPFGNTGGNPEDSPFIDGLTDELIGALAKVQGLRVTARTTAFALRGKGLDPRAMANMLGAAYLLDGSVRRSGDRFKVCAQLMQVDDASVVWSETYDRQAGEIFDVQAEVAAAIVAALAPVLGTTSAAAAAARPRDMATYELYLKGRYFWEKRMTPDLERAAGYFEEATDRDPTYAEAFAGIADAHVLLMVLCGRRPADSLPRARTAMAEALRLGSGISLVHATHGNLLSAFEWRWEESEAELRRAIELDPGVINAWNYLAIGLQHQGRFAEAIDVATLALQRDPLSPGLNLTLGRAHLHAGRPAEALRPLRTTVEIAPGFPFGLQQLGHAYLRLGRAGEAVDLFRKATMTGGRLEKGHLAYALAVAGEPEAARAALHELLDGDAQTYVPPFGIACAYAGLGEHDAVFEWLHRGYEERAAHMNTILVAPALAGLRDDPRFHALLGRLNLPAPA